MHTMLLPRFMRRAVGAAGALLVTVLLSTGGAAAQYGGRPAISTDQGSYPAGGAVVVTVTNCLPPNTTTDVLVGDVVVGEVEVNADGGGTATVTIPDATPAGDVTISTTCDGEQVATVVGVTAVVGPTPTPTPDEGGGGAGPTLPFTGGSLSLLLAQLGVGSVGLGLLFVVVARRRRRPSERTVGA